MVWYEVKRYSGQLVMYIAYMDDLNSWKVSINTPERKRIVDYVSAANWLNYERKSVDCVEAYDEAARAALSFAWNDHNDDVEQYISCDNEGNIHVGRSHKNAYWQWSKLR